jgi:hypothetical protein
VDQEDAQTPGTRTLATRGKIPRERIQQKISNYPPVPSFIALGREPEIGGGVLTVCELEAYVWRRPVKVDSVVPIQIGHETYFLVASASFQRRASGRINREKQLRTHHFAARTAPRCLVGCCAPYH